ncbi:DUF6348 family protein [Duganella sp. HH105]|uniref:DUF6348 family protein n=1 Tax=Duganella sp. HH105 TaxID=1781067 RepID=UPI0008939E18|nr:DUF6348 family protein [Duganella sp. HH105]OEZ60635.1 hypothetical protein DUGA6_28550 [Duganella sp. HH105]
MLRYLLRRFSAKQVIQESANPRTSDYLVRLFEGHGIECTIHNDWVVPNSELPALRATWFPGSASGRLDVQVIIREGVTIDECFAGIGEGEVGLNDALTNFTVNSFHVLLAALWNQNDETQVTTEDWSIGGRRFTAFIGNFGTRGSERVTADIPADLFAQLENVIKHDSLMGDLHWFRFFFCNVAGQRTFEALKDNEIWEAGACCLEGAQWADSMGYYSVRLFVALRAS